MTKKINYKLNLPSAYIIGGGFPYIKLFFDLGYRGAPNIQEANVVVFTGGEDVDPQLYGERALRTTFYNVVRDRKEVQAYEDALLLDKPMVGICRGAQFLNVMNQGKLWQHVTDHTATHQIFDEAYGKTIEVTSTHHQQMIPSDNGLVLASAEIAKEKYAFGRDEFRVDANGVENTEMSKDVEVVWYEETKSLCFQPHPEIGHRETKDYFARLLDDFVYPVI